MDGQEMSNWNIGTAALRLTRNAMAETIEGPLQIEHTNLKKKAESDHVSRCTCKKLMCKNFWKAFCRTEFPKRHSYKHNPSYENYNTWSGDYFYFVKYFLDSKVYGNVTKFGELDFGGILSIYINFVPMCVSIYNVLSTGTINLPAVLTEARTEANKLRHAAQYTCTNTDLQTLLVKLNDLLAVIANTPYNNDDIKVASDNIKFLQLNTPNIPVWIGLLTRSEINAFKSDLVEFYQHNYSSLTVAPFHKTITAPLKEMFVVPNLHMNGSENGITSWADMFGWNGSTCNNIVLSSTSREGKTTMCKFLLQEWCRVSSTNNACSLNCTNRNGRHFSDDDVLRRFDFVFFINQECGNLEKDVVKLISKHVLDRTSKSRPEGFFRRLLEQKKCLIIREGLQECSNLKMSLSKYCVCAPKIMSTIMFTSRQYCFQSENTVSVDANILLKGIGGDSIQELARKALTFLTNTFTPTFSKFQLNQKQWSSPSLRNMLRIPEFLLQLICQYIDGQSSAHESVLSMANLAFSWIDQLTLSQPLQSDCSGKTFPSKFDDTFLGKHKGLVLELGKFATEFICSPTSAFVSHSFRNKTTTKLALEAGLLLEEDDTSHASTDGVKVIFVDNAFRDLFSAIYISATKADSSRIFEHIKTAGKYSFDAINASWVYNFLQFVDKEYSKRFLENVSKLSCETLWEKFYAYVIDPIRRLFAYLFQREENGIEIGSEALVEVVSK